MHTFLPNIAWILYNLILSHDVSCLASKLSSSMRNPRKRRTDSRFVPGLRRGFATSASKLRKMRPQYRLFKKTRGTLATPQAVVAVSEMSAAPAGGNMQRNFSVEDIMGSLTKMNSAGGGFPRTDSEQAFQVRLPTRAVPSHPPVEDFIGTKTTRQCFHTINMRKMPWAPASRKLCPNL